MLVPAPTFVTSNPISPIRPVESDVTLTCTVELSSGPEIDVPLNVNFQLTKADSAESLQTSTNQSISGSTHTTAALIRSFGRHHSGSYISTATVMSTVYSSFLTSSTESFGLAWITVGKTNFW